MVDLQQCERVAESMHGESIVFVTYVGLGCEDENGQLLDVDWDFGDWHWPVVGVQLEMQNGRKFCQLNLTCSPKVKPLQAGLLKKTAVYSPADSRQNHKAQTTGDTPL
jgi:hypothetical protein